MDGGKDVNPFTDNQQADPKKQKLETSEGMSREERLNMFIASFEDQSQFQWDDDVDVSGPHKMTMREFASMRLDDIEHGVSTFLIKNNTIYFLKILIFYVV